MNIVGISGLHNSVSFKKKEFPNLSQRYHRIAQGFDSAAALVTKKGIEAVAAEERFTREKETGAFPINAIEYCLRSANITTASIDYLAHSFAYEPFKLSCEQTDFGKRQFASVYSKDAQLCSIQEYLPGYNWADKFVQVPHHLAHAASAFYVSGFKESLIFVADGMGEVQSTTIAVGQGSEIKIVAQIASLHSLGIFYGVFTFYLGFAMNLDEYKVMGLAPYGNASRYFNKVLSLINLKNDGTYTIPLLYKNTTVEEQETYGATLQVLADMFGPPRDPNAEITQHHMDLAAALQGVLQTALIHSLRHFKKETGQSNLCMAGGVALNCTANGLIQRTRLFKNLFIQPAAGDDGSALGAALYVQHLHNPSMHFEKMKLPFWGPSYEAGIVEKVLKSYLNLECRLFSSFESLAGNVAEQIARGKVVAWFQGAMEFGPRALGNRSILADPRDPSMRDHLNKLIKKREDFRPFAPAIMTEYASQFFEIARGEESLYAYMLVVAQVRAEYREQLPAVTHIDGSARVQTVSNDGNSRFWTLLEQFKAVTGIPILLNTSFNLRNQPIICTPTEAVDTFLSSEIDLLVIENYIVTRQNAI